MPPSAIASTTALLSGASPATVLTGLERRVGDDAVDRVLARVRDRTGRPVNRTELTPNSWHPLDMHLALLQEVQTETGGDPDALRSIGRDSAQAVEDAIPGAKLMLKMASPKRLMKHAPKLWGTYARFGTVDVLDAGKRHGRLAFRGYETDPVFCRTLEGFFEGLLGKLGASDVAVREVKCMADGHHCCEFEGRWS